MNKELINKLRSDAGIAKEFGSLKMVSIDKEGNIIDPMVGLENFAKLIIKECLSCFTGVDNDSFESLDYVEYLIKEKFARDDE
jgi:hypothetical protein